MQGSSSSTNSISEISNSSESGMDQQLLWNSMLLNPVEIQRMQRRITFLGDTNLSHTSMGNHDGSRLSIWSSEGPSSGHHSQSLGSLVENKVERERMGPLTIGSSSVLRTEERNFEVDNMLSLQNVDLNLNISQTDGQAIRQNPKMQGVRQNPDFVADQTGLGNEVITSNIPPLPYALDSLDGDPYSNNFTNLLGTSSMDSGADQEDDGRPENSMDHRTTFKRKSIEALHGQTSGIASTSSSHQGQHNLQHSTSHSQNPVTYLNIRSATDYPSVANPSEDYSPGYGPVPSRMFSDCYPCASLASNVESSHRNYRVRNNPAQLHDISASSLCLMNAARHSNSCPLNHPSSRSFPLNHLSEPTSLFATSSSQSQPHIPVGPVVPQTVCPMQWNIATDSRISSSLNSSSNIQDGIMVRREESNVRNMQANNILEFFPPTTDIRQIMQEPTDWTLGCRDVSIADPTTSRASTSSGLHSSVGSSSGINFSFQHLSQSSTSQELSRRVRTIPRSSHPAPHVRSAYMIGQQGILGVPLPVNMAITRNARHGIMLEAPQTMDVLRHRGDLRYEGVSLASADLHDRHRSMRLDVDNMSYEELLALEEKIGNVSTGLSKEMISKHLKSRKYLLVEAVETEPCCICLEEYVNGEELGTLNCGHYFHYACITQWLMLKNICPICRLTALVT